MPNPCPTRTNVGLNEDFLNYIRQKKLKIQFIYWNIRYATVVTIDIFEMNLRRSAARFDTGNPEHLHAGNFSFLSPW